MSLNESFIKILKIQAVFGLTPFQFNKKSNKFELTVLSLIQSLGCYIAISISVVLVTIIYQYDDEANFGNTEHFTIFSQDIVLAITYNGAMINWFLKRKDHIHFLNQLNDMSIKLKVKLDANIVPLSAFYRKCIFWQLIIIVFCICIIGNLIFRDVHTGHFKLSILIWSILFMTELATQMLVIFYIGCLAIALSHHFEIIFIKLSEILNIQYEHRNETNKDLMLCVSLFKELIFLKDNFSKLFGYQLLLIFLNEFVNLTISVYLILLYSFETSLSLSSIYIFLLFVSPRISMYVCLIHHVEKLANVVCRMSAVITRLCQYADKEIKPFLNSYLLNINYMVNTKYITAADYFTITFSMLYKKISGYCGISLAIFSILSIVLDPFQMSAAKMTYMLILFQFKQWEDINDHQGDGNKRAAW